MIIVTGGAGFIGSAIIAALNKRSITDILIVDELTYEQGSQFQNLTRQSAETTATKTENQIELKQKNLQNLRFSEYAEKKDFLEMVIDKKIDKSIEALFHMGACSSTTETDVAYLTENNYEYSRVLAQWTAEADIRFIYASSAATYGDGSEGFSDGETGLDKLKPLNAYGCSKQLFDLWARQESLLNKITGLKYFNVFGPNEYHKADMRSFILKAFEQINAAGKVRLFKSYKPEYKDGQQLRDFIYVKDAVDMTLFFLDNPQINGLFNIGTSRARTWNDLVKAVFAAMDKEENIEYIDMPDSIRNQYQYFTQAEMTKLKQAGYKRQTTSLEDAIKDYVQNYLQKHAHLGAD